MKVVVIAVLVLLVLGFVMWMAVREDRVEGLSAREKQELQALRSMRDEIFTDALNRVEVDPAAVVTIDTIRRYEMAAIKPNKKANR